MLHLKLSSFSALVFRHTVVFVLLTHSCGGQYQVIGPPQPIVALAGDDIVLPCHLEPAMDASDLTLEWARPDLNPRFVYVWRDGVELESKKHLSYKGRTSLFTGKLKHGDISLKLSKVKLSDKGKYRCFIPGLSQASLVELVVVADSSDAVIEITEVRSGELECKSKGWYPEPEVLWLDGEGNLFSAGPTETVRGPDDLYTVSSRVTVEKRHSNSFTCRVQQKNINQTRETHIHVPDHFFMAQSSSAVVNGLAVTLSVCILLAAVFVVWKCRQKKTKTKMGHEDNKQNEEEKNKSTSNNPEHRRLMERGRNSEELVKEEATMKLEKGGEKETLSLSDNKESLTMNLNETEGIPLTELPKTESGQKYSKDTGTTYVGHQREVEEQKEQRSAEENQSVQGKVNERLRCQTEINMQKEASEKQDVKKLPSDCKGVVQIQEKSENPPQQTKPKSKNKEVTKDAEMLNNKKTVTTNIKIFNVQSGEGEGKPRAESAQAQEVEKRNTDPLTVAHGHFSRF